MNPQLAKLKKVTFFLAAISTASISAMAHADWSIKGLGTLGGYSSTANGINDSGQVVGYSTNESDPYYHAFITGPNGIGMTDLGTLGGSYSRAYGINDSGQVVGFSFTSSTSNHAFITGPNGIGMTDLGTLERGQSSATGINSSGQVVGFSNSIDRDHFHAFITGPNGIGMTDLGTLGGEESRAFGINDSGQVVGYSSADFFKQAFITGPNGIGMINLGTLGGDFSEAHGINNAGEVVGVAATATGESHPFLFSHGGITDLSLLAPVVAAGWTDIDVSSINNNGQMVGDGIHNGHYEAFLLSYTPDTVFDPKPIYIPPVPEPETYLMLLAGLGLIGFIARRRKETDL